MAVGVESAEQVSDRRRRWASTTPRASTSEPRPTPRRLSAVSGAAGSPPQKGSIVPGCGATCTATGGGKERLHDQAATLVDLLHSGTAYPAGSGVLEAGCGVGAQTVTLARHSPQARLVSIDVSGRSVAEATRRLAAAGLTNVDFRQADIFALPFDAGSFDHIFGASSSSTCRARSRR